MRIGVDFDNTIVCYDGLFHRVACEQGLIPAGIPATKGAVRDYLRTVGREDDWTAMQGYVYGARLLEAPAFPGVHDFFTCCRRQGVDLCIISHKTRYPYAGARYDLHQAARDWLQAQGFFDPARIGLKPGQVQFRLTLHEKLDSIAQQRCTHFIDDLPELLAEPSFPAGVERLLFDASGGGPNDARWRRFTTWKEIEGFLLCSKKLCA
jgi:hypothetical protein